MGQQWSQQRLQRSSSSPPSSSSKKKNVPHRNFVINSAALAVCLMMVLSSTVVVVEAVSTAAMTTTAAAATTTTTTTTTNSNNHHQNLWWRHRQLQQRQQKQQKQLVVIAGPSSSGSISMYKFLDRYATTNENDKDSDNDSNSNSSQITGWNWPTVSSNDMATIAATDSDTKAKDRHEIFDYLFSDSSSSSSSSSNEFDDVQVQQILLKSIRDAWMTATESTTEGGSVVGGGVFVGSDEFERVGSTSTSTSTSTGTTNGSNNNNAALSVLFRIKENLSIPSNDDITIVLFYQNRRVDQLSRLIWNDESFSSGPDPPSYEDFICSVHEDDTSGKWNYLDVSMVRFISLHGCCSMSLFVGALFPYVSFCNRERDRLFSNIFRFHLVGFWFFDDDKSHTQTNTNRILFGSQRSIDVLDLMSFLSIRKESRLDGVMFHILLYVRSRVWNVSTIPDGSNRYMTFGHRRYPKCPTLSRRY